MSRNGEIVLVVLSLLFIKVLGKMHVIMEPSDSWKEGNPDTWRYIRLKMFQKNEESGEYEDLSYHLGAGEGYNRFRTMKSLML